MSTLILDHRNINLEYDNQCLVIRQPDRPVRTVPLRHLQKVVCLHSVQLTTSLLGQLWKRGIDFVTLNSRHSDCSFGLYPNHQQQVERRCRQYQWQQDPHTGLQLAQTLCTHRIRNNLRLLDANSYPQLKTQLQAALDKIPHARNLGSLLGIEGTAQRQMFAHWRERLPPQLGFEKRQRKPTKDPVNGLLSLTSTLVLQDAIRQCTTSGLDPDLGFYHRTAPGRPSLACDLMEPVRPCLEHWVMQLFLTGTLDSRHFTGSNNPDAPCYLGKSGRELFYPLYYQAAQPWKKQLQATARWLSRNMDKMPEAGL